jgi:Flp pilus assembly pilin Flp
MVRTCLVRLREALRGVARTIRESAEVVVVRARLVAAGAASLAKEEGQTTAEYALVILAAAAVALVLLAWAKSSGKLPDFFNKIIDSLSGDVQ